MTDNQAFCDLLHRRQLPPAERPAIPPADPAAHVRAWEKQRNAAHVRAWEQQRARTRRRWDAILGVVVVGVAVALWALVFSLMTA